MFVGQLTARSQGAGCARQSVAKVPERAGGPSFGSYHKPPTGNGKYSTFKIGDDWGMVQMALVYPHCCCFFVMDISIYNDMMLDYC